MKTTFISKQKLIAFIFSFFAVLLMLSISGEKAEAASRTFTDSVVSGYLCNSGMGFSAWSEPFQDTAGDWALNQGAPASDVQAMKFGPVSSGDAFQPWFNNGGGTPERERYGGGTVGTLTWTLYMLQGNTTEQTACYGEIDLVYTPPCPLPTAEEYGDAYGVACNQVGSADSTNQQIRCVAPLAETSYRYNDLCDGGSLPQICIEPTGSSMSAHQNGTTESGTHYWSWYYDADADKPAHPLSFNGEYSITGCDDSSLNFAGYRAWGPGTGWPSERTNTTSNAGLGGCRVEVRYQPENSCDIDTRRSAVMTFASTPLPATYDLDVRSSGASNVPITSSTGHGGTTDYTEYNVPEDFEVILTAPSTAPTGEGFNRWEGCSSVGGSNSRTCYREMDDDYTVTAFYNNTPSTYDLRVEADGAVNVPITSSTGDGGTTDYTSPDLADGHDARLTAPSTAPTGEEFDRWVGCAGTSGGGMTCHRTMDRDRTVIAYYTTPAGSPSGNISASPNPCTIPNGGTLCDSLISWSNIQNTDNVQVYLSNGNLFASAGSENGSQNADWIDDPGTTFTLRTDSTNSSNGTYLDHVFVEGNMAGSPSGNISASPNPCTIPNGGTHCDSQITWNNIQNTDNAQIYISNGTQIWTSNENGGSENVDWIDDPGTTFTLRTDSTNSSNGTYLDHVFVEGDPETPGSQTLNFSKLGTGQGTIVSSPAGINCGTTCSSESASYSDGAFVTLTASWDSNNNTFEGWGGDCSAVGNDCVARMNGTKNVTARFDNTGLPQPPTITVDSTSCDQIDISWTAVPGASRYLLEVDGSRSTLGNVTSYSHTGLAANTSHTYRVRPQDIWRTNITDWSALESETTDTNCTPLTSPDAYLRYSDIPGRTPSELLDGAELDINKNYYIFTEVEIVDPNSHVNEVSFSLNNGRSWNSDQCSVGQPDSSNQCYKNEGFWPYDLAGGSDLSASPFQFTQTGSHTIISYIDYKNFNNANLSATFTVSDSGGGNPTFEADPRVVEEGGDVDLVYNTDGGTCDLSGGTVGTVQVIGDGRYPVEDLQATTEFTLACPSVAPMSVIVEVVPKGFET